MDATAARQTPPVHHGEVPRFDYMPEQRDQNCIKVRLTLKKGEWPITFHVPGLWVRDIVSNTRQWVDARFVKLLIEIPGSPEKRGPVIITEEWRQVRGHLHRRSEVSARDGLMATVGFIAGVGVTFMVLAGTALLNNATAVLAAAL